MKNNFQSSIEKSVAISYLDDKVFNIQNDNTQTESIIENNEENDQYDLIRW